MDPIGATAVARSHCRLGHSRSSQVARKYATTEANRQAIINGAKESLLIDRSYINHLAELLEALP
jgi:hypothetical protein